MLLATRTVVPRPSSTPAGAATRAAHPIHGSLNAWRVALFAALGLNVAQGCGGSTTSQASDDGTRLSALACDPSAKQLIDGEDHDTGFLMCAGRWYHRPQRADCPSLLPRVQSADEYAQCRDASCTSKPNGYCVVEAYPVRVTCVYGCVRDEDCGSGQVCFCDSPAGRCVTASCATDADCPGSLCLGTINASPCGDSPEIQFACAQAGDQCQSGGDCGDPRQSNWCQVGVEDVNEAGESLGVSPRQCVPGPACGRPYLVDGSARTASAEPRCDWLAATTPDLRALGGDTRRELSVHYSRLGRMEHASVAAFARFVIELLAVGAPAELVSAAQGALGDEIEHTRLCFGLASAYAGAPVGPGVLSAHGVLADTSLAATVTAAIHEACVGETLAAVEASEALAGATDPAVRAVLERVVLDESAHAELGWRFLQWVLEGASPELREIARVELARAIETARDAAPAAAIDPAGPASSHAGELERHGCCSPRRVHAARRAALERLVIPLARELFLKGAGTRALHPTRPHRFTARLCHVESGRC